MTSRYDQKTLGSYKRTFNQVLLQITERPAASSGSSAKVTIGALGGLICSALANKYLGLSLLP